MKESPSRKIFWIAFLVPPLFTPALKQFFWRIHGEGFYLFGLAFSLGLLLTPLFRRVSFTLKILDYPASRKVHLKPTPLLGGVAVYLSFCLSTFYCLEVTPPFLGVFLGSSLIFTVGLLDDIYELSTSSRLFFQLLASLLMIVSGVRLSFLPPTWWGDTGEVLLTILWIVGLTNAVNFLDGLDGLAAGMVTLICFFFYLISLQVQQIYIGFLVLALLGAALGFLPYNFRSPIFYLESKFRKNPTASPHALVFLGDSGATFLGTLLAGLAVQGNLAEDHLVALAIPILLLGVPIFDMSLTTIMRIREKKITSVSHWLSYAGKDHFHHRLVDLGFTPMGSVFFIYVVTVVLGLGAFGLRRGETLDAVMILMEAGLIFVLIALLMISGRRAAQQKSEDV